MPSDRPAWIVELDHALKGIADRYTPGRYPRTITTQRDYEQGIDTLEGIYRERLAIESNAERRLINLTFQDDPSLPTRANRLAQDQCALVAELNQMIQSTHDLLNRRFGFTRDYDRDR